MFVPLEGWLGQYGSGQTSFLGRSDGILAQSSNEAEGKGHCAQISASLLPSSLGRNLLLRVVLASSRHVQPRPPSCSRSPRIS
jgi:hypothetical protein